MRLDVPVRLLPFAVAAGLVELLGRPSWLGVGGGRVQVQLAFGLAGLPLMFALACAVQLLLTRRRGVLRVPATPGDAALQGAYYVVNGPLEEAFFRGLLQGGTGAIFGPLVGFLMGTATYVFYHRLGGWTWTDVGATALVGVPMGLAYWLLPGPPSLLGVSLAHIGATCGFLGPGPYLLRRFHLL